jgi:TPR repeat protein
VKTSTTLRIYRITSVGLLALLALMPVAFSTPHHLCDLCHNGDDSRADPDRFPAQQNEADRKVLAEIRAGADKGDAKAQYELARPFFSGTLGVAKDEAEAVKWYRKAAEQNVADAQYNLGVLLGRASFHRVSSSTKTDTILTLLWSQPTPAETRRNACDPSDDCGTLHFLSLSIRPEKRMPHSA